MPASSSTALRLRRSNLVSDSSPHSAAVGAQPIRMTGLNGRLALIILLRGFSDAIMMRQLAGRRKFQWFGGAIRIQLAHEGARPVSHSSRIAHC